MIKAAQLARNNKERQTSLLDLLQVFREFTETGSVTTAKTASKALATQVATLEQATRKISQQAKQPTTFATIAARGTQPTQARQLMQARTTPQQGPRSIQDNWTVVQSRKTRTEPTQLVLGLKDKTATVNSLYLRDTINQLAKEAGYQGVLVGGARKTGRNNLALVFLEPRARLYTTNNLSVIQRHIDITRILEDST